MYYEQFPRKQRLFSRELNLFLVLMLKAVNCFPESGFPQMIVPPIQRAQAKSCSIEILSANCSNYDSVESQLLQIPPDCPGRAITLFQMDSF
jgi:hypothetical protein